MDAARLRTPYVQLTKLFLRQFLENDLIAPDADRSQLLAVVGGLVVSLTLFISMFLSGAYLGAGLAPAEAAVRALDDRFFFLSLSMVMSALVAASQWDALAIDARDAAILEPFPVPAGTIRRAKLSAVAILGAAVALAINLFPSLIFPWLLVISLPQMSYFSLVWLVVTHATLSLAAAAFGYLVVITIRETLAAVLGRRGFTAASPWVQGALIVVLGSALLLVPPSADGLARRGFVGWRAAAPSSWFLGVYEVAAGGVIADLPRREMDLRHAAADFVASFRYDERRQEFPALARRAGLALGLVFLFGAAAYLWNARRLPSLGAAPPPSFRRHWRLGARLADAVLVRDQSARAGFYFTLAAMWRSSTHRLTLACAAAVGFAMAVVMLSSTDVREGMGPSARILSLQPLLYGALLVGFRHVIRVPAELRANWGFQLAWRGRERAFLAGAKRAAIVALVLPAIGILLPLYVFLLGAGPALLHALLGLAGGVVFLETLLVTYDKVPFTCTYVPTENMKALGPVYAVMFMIGAANFARMQNEALVSGNPTRLLVTLAVVFAAFRIATLKRKRMPQVEFDEAPATYQRLGLHT